MDFEKGKKFAQKFCDEIFVGMRAQEFEFLQCRFENCRFVRCGFLETIFSRCEFANCEFLECTFSECEFSECKAEAATAKNCVFFESKFFFVESENFLFEKTEFFDAKFGNALASAPFRMTNFLFAECDFERPEFFPNVEFDTTSFKKCKFWNAKTLKNDAFSTAMRDCVVLPRPESFSA